MVRGTTREGSFLQLRALMLVLVACSMRLLSSANAHRNSMSSRQRMFRKYIASASTAVGINFLSVNHPIPSAQAAVLQEPKQMKLSNEAIARIVQDDINIRQALVTADFTRSIYSEQATFTDEIDTYDINKYITGTKALFDPTLSKVSIDGPVSADDNLVSFRFNEKLTFNVPFKPYVMLTGRVDLTRSPDDGLIYSSREFWDETPSNVLKTVKFN